MTFLNKSPIGQLAKQKLTDNLNRTVLPLL